MIVIFGLLIALALFFFWLSGHWFARWLVAMALFVPIFMIAALMGGAGLGLQDKPVCVLAFAFSAGVSWLIASLPTFHLRAIKAR